MAYSADTLRFEGGRAWPAVRHADIDAKRDWQLLILDAIGHHARAIVLHPVMHQQGAIFRQTPQTRLRVAVGTVDGNRPDLDAAETERGKGCDGFTVLVIAGGEADRVRESYACDGRLQARFRDREEWCEAGRRPCHARSQPDSEMMGRFRLQTECHRPDHAGVNAHDGDRIACMGSWSSLTQALH